MSILMLFLTLTLLAVADSLHGGFSYAQSSGNENAPPGNLSCRAAVCYDMPLFERGGAKNCRRFRTRPLIRGSGSCRAAATGGRG